MKQDLEQNLIKALGKILSKNLESENKQRGASNIKRMSHRIQVLNQKKKSLFDSLLPQILGHSKEIFSKLDNKIGRPIIQLKKDGLVNGEKIKSKIYEYNKNLVNRFPREHYASSKYSNDYGVQDIRSIRHLLNGDNRTMTSYLTTYLRRDKKKTSFYKKKQIKEKKDSELAQIKGILIKTNLMN